MESLSRYLCNLHSNILPFLLMHCLCGAETASSLTVISASHSFFEDRTYPLPTIALYFYTGGCVCWMILYTPDHMINSLIRLVEMTKNG